MNNKVLKTIKKYSMLDVGDNIIVGFSGGADSSALLDFLNSIKVKYDLKLVACHINHNIRGLEAMRDQHFCELFCKERNINLKVFNIDVPKLSKERNQSTELCARELRYEIFGDLMQEHSAKLATAHTITDSCETVLWNLTRGSGLKGLCGIPAIREDNIIRPLIECTRKQIEDYCQNKHINFVTDSTNLGNDYTRNKIRNLVMPVLKDLNPSAELTIGRMSSIVKCENDFIEGIAKQSLNQCALNEGYDVGKLRKLHPAILNRVLSEIIETFNEKPNYKFIELLKSIIFEGNGAVELSKKTILEVKNDILDIRKLECVTPYFEKRLQVGEIVLNESKTIEISIISYPDYKKFINFSKDVLKKSLDYDKMLYNACIRQKCAGDKISLVGKSGSKSIKKLFNEYSLSISERSKRFVICDKKGVIFLEGFGCDKRVQVEENSKNIMIIEHSSK